MVPAKAGNAVQFLWPAAAGNKIFPAEDFIRFFCGQPARHLTFMQDTVSDFSGEAGSDFYGSVRIRLAH